MRQVANVANFMTYARELDRYRDSAGSYPRELERGVARLQWFNGLDSWSEPIRYESDGQRFAIVSAGSDRAFAHSKYLELEPREEPNHQCDETALDQVLLSTGWYRACGS